MISVITILLLDDEVVVDLHQDLVVEGQVDDQADDEEEPTSVMVKTYLQVDMMVSVKRKLL